LVTRGRARIARERCLNPFRPAGCPSDEMAIGRVGWLVGIARRMVTGTRATKPTVPAPPAAIPVGIYVRGFFPDILWRQPARFVRIVSSKYVCS
jgi:hypothetical protein